MTLSANILGADASRTSVNPARSLSLALQSPARPRLCPDEAKFNTTYQKQLLYSNFLTAQKKALDESASLPIRKRSKYGRHPRVSQFLLTPVNSHTDDAFPTSDQSSNNASCNQSSSSRPPVVSRKNVITKSIPYQIKIKAKHTALRVRPRAIPPSVKDLHGNELGVGYFSSLFSPLVEEANAAIVSTSHNNSNAPNDASEAISALLFLKQSVHEKKEDGSTTTTANDILNSPTTVSRSSSVSAARQGVDDSTSNSSSSVLSNKQARLMKAKQALFQGYLQALDQRMPQYSSNNTSA